MKPILKFQEGGQVPTNQPQEGSQDPLAMIAEMAVQAVQSQDCQTALQVCQAFVEMAAQAQRGAQQAPAQGEPVFKMGGKLLRRN